MTHPPQRRKSMKVPLPTYGELIAAWGDTSFVRLPAEVSAPLGASIDYLHSTGFPSYLHFHNCGMEEIFDFRSIERGLMSLCDMDFNFDPPGEWGRYWVFGDATFSNGGAYWALGEPDGVVYRVDVELDEPFEVVSLGIDTFALSILSFHYWWAGSPAQAAASSAEQLDYLEVLLKHADPAAWRRPRKFWRNLVQWFRDCSDEPPEDTDELFFVTNIETKPKRAVF